MGNRFTVFALVLASVAGQAARAQVGPGPMALGGGNARPDSATMVQMEVIHELFRNHDRVLRSVTLLPNGVRTVTESLDPRLTYLIREHVVTMVDRVKTSEPFGCPLESAAVLLLYREKDKIQTTIQPTRKGVMLTQTSSDPAVVAALKQHATEVSELVRYGMTARHEGIMKQRAMLGEGLPCGMRPQADSLSR